MSNTVIPRIVVSGLRGGGGKTVLSLSLVALLKNRGYNVVTFKKGPDYIDAGWLAKASGAPCYNLDTFMMTPEQAAGSFAAHSENAQIAVIEGNRGLYDGVDHKGTYSTAELAKLLDAPVIIAVDCTKTTNTIAALVLGCQNMDPDVRIGGVVLNRVATKRQESVIREAIAERCGLPVLGAIPRLKKDPFPERHMGLTPFQEHAEIEDSIAAVTEIGTEYLDLDGIMKIIESSGSLTKKARGDGQGAIKELKSDDAGPRIGVIRDSAFQFYYQENFEALEKRGAVLVEVSPLKEKRLPDIDALYIGGGFPETHAIALAENTAFKESLLTAIENGLPVYAECGGLMYLGRSLVMDDRTYSMVGALPIVFGLQKRPLAHGYTIVEVAGRNPFFQQKTIMKGHEFHYSNVLEIEEDGFDFAFNMKRGKGIVDNRDGICYKNVLASYTHLHAVGAPDWADGMVRCAIGYKIQNMHQNRG
ncbi:MAG: cobyrinate a,c-diamide synthase [Nitrospira sp.]|nr:cobyrinate a,c-diamide synthase [Nitrospira sp.]